MMSWLAGTADLLVGQAPRVAAELLGKGRRRYPRPGRPGTAGWPAGSPTPSTASVTGPRPSRWPTARWSTPPSPISLVDLHWTLAQCRMLAGESAESLATLDRALASPGITARHRARLLALAARTHSSTSARWRRPARSPPSALAAASEAGDNWAMGWALHVLALVTAVRGHRPTRCRCSTGRWP